ncbi:uncharacterized protein E0L32_012371 [Thyridium curvatum]|uniref:Siroheme synthase n=1 Tax=Thyridium curvatum TaxID=1093900 RepID=A0A507BAB2_9PEZI|nr:uncharacterized protein E0L32_012371 [Thyridium curvatum]TPX16797.1 hypothetical protein E0L32_012371 [Thyridium curvatum]
MSRRTRPRASSPQAPPSTGTDNDAGEVSSQDEIPFFNTTFSLHRISPLYIGAESLTPGRLRTLSGRLRDTLVGDVVRGVEVGLDGGDSTMGSAGALETVLIEWVSVDGLTGSGSGSGRKGLSLALQYENATSTALLLPSAESHDQDGDDKSVQLSLLLLRMPAPLKAIVINFLCSTFDCRVSSLRLSSRDLIQSWEGWIQDVGVSSSGPLAKDAVITLGFRNLAAENRARATDEETASAEDKEELGIKTIDIIIPGKGLRRFVAAGEALPADKDDEPFTAALAAYVKHHIALDIWHPAVHIARVACGGFVLSEGRIKIFLPDERDQSDSARREGVRRLVDKLVARATESASRTVDLG